MDVSLLAPRRQDQPARDVGPLSRHEPRDGGLYDHGIGVTENAAEALKWYRKAADQGESESAFAIGNMYANGYGGPARSLPNLLGKAQANRGSTRRFPTDRGAAI